MRVFLAAIFFCPLIAWAQIDSLMIYYRSGAKAYELQDYESFYRAMERANQIRPGHPTLTYNLACGAALTGKPALAISVLKDFVLMNALHDFQADSDFISLRKHAAYQELIRLQQQQLDTITTSEQVFKITYQAFHPESITYYRPTKSYFFGDVRSRRVMHVTRNGQVDVWVDQQQDMYAVMGIVIDESRQELWATTAALPEMIDHDSTVDGKSSVFVFDLVTKVLKNQWKFDDRLLVGITQSPDGTILLGDVKHNHLLKIENSQQDATVLIDLSDHFMNIQGMTFDQKGSQLYLSDYLTGIYFLDSNLELRPIALPDHVSFKGIDGLYWHNGSLYATQNGTRPMRVYKFGLNAAGDRIIDTELLDQSGILNEPTTGTFTDTHFLYIANSPWGAYDKSGNFEPDRPVIILAQELK